MNLDLVIEVRTEFNALINFCLKFQNWLDSFLIKVDFEKIWVELLKTVLDIGNIYLTEFVNDLPCLGISKI